MWYSVKDFSPPQRQVVLTKIDTVDGGVRNIQQLKLDGRLWWMPDGKMYVYYEPTHWKPI
jgi:hypothetical protein